MYEPGTLCRNSEWCAISVLKSSLAASSICVVVIVGELCTRLPQIGIMASKTLKLAGFPRPYGVGGAGTKRLSRLTGATHGNGVRAKSTAKARLWSQVQSPVAARIFKGL